TIPVKSSTNCLSALILSVSSTSSTRTFKLPVFSTAWLACCIASSALSIAVPALIWAWLLIVCTLLIVSSRLVNPAFVTAVSICSTASFAVCLTSVIYFLDCSYFDLFFSFVLSSIFYYT